MDNAFPFTKWASFKKPRGNLPDMVSVTLPSSGSWGYYFGIRFAIVRVLEKFQHVIFSISDSWSLWWLKFFHVTFWASAVCIGAVGNSSFPSMIFIYLAHPFCFLTDVYFTSFGEKALSGDHSLAMSGRTVSRSL